MSAAAAAALPVGLARQARAVLFDLDGTLLDTEPLSTEAINKAVAPHTQKRCDWELKKKLLGRKALGENGWCSVCLAELGVDEQAMSPEQLNARWGDELKLLYPKATVLPGVEQLTAHLVSSPCPRAPVPRPCTAVQAAALCGAVRATRVRVLVAPLPCLCQPAAAPRQQHSLGQNLFQPAPGPATSVRSARQRRPWPV